MEPMPRSFSGKRLTMWLLAILLATGGLFYWVTTAYGTYNAARRQTDVAWKALAVQLDLRYRALDKAIARAVDAQTVDMRLGEQWRSTRDRFAATTLSSEQTEAAVELEQIVEQLPTEIRATGPEPQLLTDAVEQYDRAVAEQRRVGSTFGSRLLKVMLNLPDPTAFKL